MQKSKPQSKQAPICTTLGMKLFFSFPTPINLFETTPKDENQQRPEVQTHLATKNKQVLNKNEGEK
jgi:hypothetical protein